MKQEIKITVDVPDGYKAYWDGEKVVTVEENYNGLPRTWEEFCRKNPIVKGESYITIFSNIMDAQAGERKQLSDKNILPDRESTIQHLALMQLHQLRDCYRQGWVPDWECNNDKYFILFDYWTQSKFVIHSWKHTPRFLSFQSRKVAEKFLANFKDLILEAGDLI